MGTRKNRCIKCGAPAIAYVGNLPTRTYVCGKHMLDADILGGNAEPRAVAPHNADKPEDTDPAK
ncbi:MAG: hypothetical protein JO256_00420 [Alphaproteobacteria bacterium]|nr:hypothetical protein [Alphaproteobacteria bacterium]